MDKILSSFGSIVEEEPGVGSTMRITQLACVFIPLLVWAFVSFKSVELKALPDNIVWVIGIAFAGKLVQKKIEASPTK